MKKWNVTYYPFKDIREKIKQDEIDDLETYVSEILYALKRACWDIGFEIAKYSTDFASDFMTMRDEIEEEIACLDDEDGDMELVNNVLCDFYDLCDAARVWLPI